LFNIHKDKGEDISKLAVVASTVSSKFMKKMAEVEGF